MPDKRKLLRAWLFAMSRLEIILRAEQGRARNAMIRKAAKAYEESHHPPAHIFVAHRARTRANIEDHYKRTIPVFADLATRQVRCGKSRKSAYDALIQRWIAREALRKATLIADTDRDDVLAAISKGLEDGLGVAEVARNIRKVTALTPFRAATVARTETHAADTFGSVESVREAERELGVKMLKEWLPTNDDRTRPEHRAMAGYGPIPMDEKFSVGGETMDRPGDPAGSPENTIACRCSIIYSEAE